MPWHPISIEDCLNRFIGRDTIDDGWAALTPKVKCAPCPIDPAARNETDIDEHYAKRFDKLASELIDKRVANPIRDVAYGKEREDGCGNRLVYPVNGTNETGYDRRLISDILSAKSYGGFLFERFVWTTIMTASVFAVFFVATVFFADYGVWAGLMAFLAAVGVGLLWIAYRFFEERSVKGAGTAFRARGSMAPIDAVAKATDFLDSTLDKFVDDLKDYQNECLRRVDDPVGSYDNTADWLARSQAAWALARRAAQYISFQPINIDEIYSGNGVSARRMFWADVTFILALLGVIGITLLVAFAAPAIVSQFSPQAAEVFGSIDIGFVTIAQWPLFLAVSLAFFVLWNAETDRGAYRRDRNRVALAMVDFWRRGKKRSADEIAALTVPPDVTYDNWLQRAVEQMLAEEANPATFEEWKSLCEWNQDVIATDPTSQMMRKLINFLNNTGTKQTKIVFGEEPPAGRLVPRHEDRSGPIRSDARPCTRALATLTRREIWHP